MVDVAYRGADGLHLAQTREYDQIVLDIMQLRIRGWRSLEALCSKVDDPFTPALIHTVHGMGYVLEPRE